MVYKSHAPSARPGSITARGDAPFARYRDITHALSHEAGDDPLYVLYPAVIENQAKRFVTGLDANILYAVKANPHPLVLQTLWQSGVRHFDVASQREISAVRAVLPEATLYLMHPVKSRGTIAAAFAAGVRHFAVDCAEELAKMKDVIGDLSELTVHVRISLSEAGGHDAAAMPLTGKFGTRGKAAVTLLNRVAATRAGLGATFHVGSQCLSPVAYGEAIAAVRVLIDAAGVSLASLDVGGGFPVAYPGMACPDWSAYFTAIEAARCTHGFATTRMLAEPGRALVAEAGSTLTRIELRKGRDLYLNEGTYGSLFDAGTCGWRYPVSLYTDRYGPFVSLGDHHDQPQTAFRFFGPTCDSIDRMDGPFMLPDSAREGDWIEIHNLGAYGQVMATRFNGFYGTRTIVIEDAGLATAPQPAAPSNRRSAGTRGLQPLSSKSRQS